MRNGLSLCRNHHGGFDNGVWSLKDDGEILVSEKLTASAAYVTKEAEDKNPLIGKEQARARTTKRCRRSGAALCRST
jgi:predicted restriction endonuclease